METDLYLKIQNKLVRGYNIQTLECTSWTTKDGESAGRVTIQYLYGQRLLLDVKPALTAENLQQILEQINTIQELGCYPQPDSTCELGITSLN